MTAAAARTHAGLKRRRNEDRFYLGDHLAVVADGMGGQPAGDVASATAVEAVAAFDREVDPADLPAHLSQVVDAASIAMQRRIASDPEVAGMGTTLVAFAWSAGRFALANIGDSRAYRLRAGKLLQLTDDHTYGRLLAHASSMPNLPERISRFLDGRVDGRSPDLAPFEARPGDRLLLCSDGLSSFVGHDHIEKTLA
jgi:serine/threonine protein phosphatase PrpC